MDSVQLECKKVGVFAIAGPTAPQVQKIIEDVAKNIVIVVERVYDFLSEIFPVWKEYLKNKESRTMLYKLDFTRPRIEHQVTDRRPKLVKKIIR